MELRQMTLTDIKALARYYAKQFKRWSMRDCLECAIAELAAKEENAVPYFVSDNSYRKVN